MALVTIPPSPFPPSSGKTGDIAERVTELETDVSTLQTNVGTLGTTKAPKTDIAPIFSAETNYTVGDLVYYDGALYECTTDHDAGEWNSENFTATAINTQLNEINSNLTNGLNALRGINGSWIQTNAANQTKTFVLNSDFSRYTGLMLITANNGASAVYHVYCKKDSTKGITKLSGGDFTIDIDQTTGTISVTLDQAWGKATLISDAPFTTYM